MAVLASTCRQCLHVLAEKHGQYGGAERQLVKYGTMGCASVVICYCRPQSYTSSWQCAASQVQCAVLHTAIGCQQHKTDNLARADRPGGIGCTATPGWHTVCCCEGSCCTGNGTTVLQFAIRKAYACGSLRLSDVGLTAWRNECHACLCTCAVTAVCSCCCNVNLDEADRQSATTPSQGTS